MQLIILRSSSLFIFGFSISADLCNGSLRADDSSLALSHFLLLEFPCHSQFPAMRMYEKSTRKKNSWTNQVRRMVHDLMCRNEFLAFLHEMWFQATRPVVTVPQILRRVFQVRELPAYFQEALPSRTSPIHRRVPLPLLLLALRRWLPLPSSDFSISSRSPIRLS